MFKYHPEHSWVKADGDGVLVGLSYYAQAHLGKIVYMDLPPAGARVTSGLALCGIESEKTTSEVISPVSGRVLEANAALEAEPGLINDSPLEAGWIARVRPDNEAELDGLMDLRAYERYLTENQAEK